MSAHNFWNNFNIGFLHGMFNSNPFFGCCMNNFPVFNSCFMPVFNTSNLFFVPNVFSAMNFSQLMPNMSPPMPDTGQIDINKLFPVDKWQMPVSDNYSFNFNAGMFDTFQKTSGVETNIKKGSSSAQAKMLGSSINEKYFDKMLSHILSQEGGYVNDPSDSGGETNKGVTKATYDAYRKKKGLPLRNVREITDAEVREIYHEFFTGSGADKIDNPRMALMVFDTAVGSGCAKAKELFRKSGGDINKYEELRREWYADIVRRRPKDKKFIKGWNNRITHTMEFASANLPSSTSA